MHDELTRKDIEMMKKELDERRTVLRPKLLEEVKVARAFGDLSENFEYKEAKREKNANERRIRYLEGMIRTAKVIDEGYGDGVALFDKVTVLLPEDGSTEVWQVVTTMRQNVLEGRISKESPVGKALLGHKAGETVHIQVNEQYSYDMVIQSIEKGTDDGSIPINSY